MGFFKKESEEEKIAKIRKLREEAKEVNAKYNAVQKRKALDRVYAKEKAEVDKRKFESSKLGHIVGIAQSVGSKVASGVKNSSAYKQSVFAAPMKKTNAKPKQQYDFVFGNAGRSGGYDAAFGNAPKKKKGKTYDPIFG